MKFTKKPVTIEAITFEEFVALTNGESHFVYNGHPCTNENDKLWLIPTLEGIHNFTPLDMLITGVAGEIYPCKKDIFEKTYGTVETNKRAFLTVEQGTTYEVPVYEVIDGRGIEETGKVLSIQFVRGSKLKDENVEKREGTLHEHLISVMIEDLKFKNSILPSKETACAITHLQEAQHWLEERVKVRESAGVLGTYQPHK